MNKLIYFFLLLPLLALGQPVPPPATQTEVNAGLNKFKYVTPFTLQGWTVGGATGAVTVAQLNSSSNAIIAILVANDTTTSNGVFTTETTRNAAVSNALVTLLVANDTTTSNGVVTLLVANDTFTSNSLFTTETTRNAAVSNALVTLLVANDTTTSNGLVTVLVANDTTTSNGVVAFTMTASNNVWTAGNTLNLGVSNAVISYLLGVAVTNGDTRTTWINNLNVGTDFRVTNNAYVSGVSFVGGAFNVGGQATFTNGLVSLSQVFIQQDNLTVGGLGGTLNLYGGFSTDSTNAIHTQTEDFSPAIGDYILTEDISAGRLKKVSIGNLPFSGGAGEANVTGEISKTNATVMGLTYDKAGVTNRLRSLRPGFGQTFTNESTNIVIAVDNAIIPSQTQLNTASNALYSVAAPVGPSGAIQFSETGVQNGTNSAVSDRLYFDRTNLFLHISRPSSVGDLTLGNNAIVQAVSTPLYIGTANRSNWLWTSTGHYTPTDTSLFDIGSSALRVRTNWANVDDLSAALALRDPSSINSGRGTLFAHPSDWKVTNQFNWAITNPVAGQQLMIVSKSISGGLNTIVLTNDYPVVKALVANTGVSTNIVMDWANTNYYVATPSNNFTVVWTNAPSAGSPAQRMTLEVQNTNSTLAAFPTNGLNNGSLIVLSAPSTNIFQCYFDGQNFWIESGQILTTGSGDTNVFNNFPVLHGATNEGNFVLLPSSGSVSVLKSAVGSVAVTNILGLIQKTYASVVELDFNAAAKFSITNRVTAATSLILTNGSDGQDLSAFMVGEASGGTARVITIQPQLGHLVANEDAFGVGLATSFSFTLTNGNAAEISASIRRLNGTNIMGVVTRQFQF